MLSGKIFRNRWAALLWAGGILWTAYDVASAPPSRPDTTANSAADNQTDALGEPVTQNDLAILANAVGG